MLEIKVEILKKGNNRRKNLQVKFTKLNNNNDKTIEEANEIFIKFHQNNIIIKIFIKLIMYHQFIFNIIKHSTIKIYNVYIKFLAK